MKLCFLSFISCFTLLVMASCFLLCAAGGSEWNSIYLRFHSGHFYRATSELNAPQNNVFGPYGMYRLFDGSLQTCWAEGVKGPGIEESLYLNIEEGTRFLNIANGYQKSPALFRANNRVKTLQAAVLVGINIPGEATELFTIYHSRMMYPVSKTLSLRDISGFQEVNLPFDWKSLQRFKDKTLAQFMTEHKIAKGHIQPDIQYILQLRIMGVYKGSKYDDTCISEITPELPERDFSVKKVYLNKSENTIYIDTETKAEIVLVSDQNAVFQIVELSPDKKWVIVIKSPAAVGASRIETTYLLYNTRLKTLVAANLLGADVGEMYDFTRKGDTMYLNYLNQKTLSIESLDLKPLYKKLSGEKN